MKVIEPITETKMDGLWPQDPDKKMKRTDFPGSSSHLVNGTNAIQTFNGKLANILIFYISFGKFEYF